jgi:hypothetical protein
MLNANEPDETKRARLEQLGGDGAVPSQVEIRRKCAFTYI